MKIDHLGVRPTKAERYDTMCAICHSEPEQAIKVRFGMSIDLIPSFRFRVGIFLMRRV
jgi:hypothetical protein